MFPTRPLLPRYPFGFHGLSRLGGYIENPKRYPVSFPSFSQLESPQALVPRMRTLVERNQGIYCPRLYNSNFEELLPGVKVGSLFRPSR